MAKEYEEYRDIELKKNYELIHNKLMKELTNIKDRNINIKDTYNIKTYIEEEVRKKIFKKKGVPTFILKIILLLGTEYEKEMKSKINNYIVSEYVTDFQIFISQEFKKLSDIKKYYKKTHNLIKEIENVYFNLPSQWDTKTEIFSDIYIIIKQKVCDIIFFNDFEYSDYLICMDCVIENEKGICEILGDVKKSVFHLLVPFVNSYFEEYFEKTTNTDFDVKKSEMKIFTNFVTFFKDFEKIYEKVSFYENVEAITILKKSFEMQIVKLLSFMARSNFSLDYDLEGCLDYNNKDFNKIVVILNTISYLNECISDLNSNLYCTYEINLTQDLFIKIGNLENKFNGMLEIYIRNLINNVDFNKTGISHDIIKILQKNIFLIELEDLYEDLKINLVEIIILQILSRIYLLDFDEENAELMIYDLYELKKYLGDLCENIGSFQILESYLKIFMCSPKDMQTFIENFKILSNNIFSFKQIVWSLKDKNIVMDLLEIFETTKNQK